MATKSISTRSFSIDHLAGWYAGKQYASILDAYVNDQVDFEKDPEWFVYVMHACFETGEYELYGKLYAANPMLAQATPSLSALLGKANAFLGTIQQAIQEITSGQHATDAISFLKANIRGLLDNHRFDTALALLHQTSIARQAKTTNILWIGSYLKDLYFNDRAENLKQKFDKLLMEEMLFYFLKSCKLYDPAYAVIKNDIKRFND
jgi:hypothetical protein